MADKKSKVESLEEENARVLAEMAVDSETPESLRVTIIQKLLENTQSNSFFATLFNEKLDFGKCPTCEHENHWLTPELFLNELGWVTHTKDSRVPKQTKSKDCSRFQESCRKKKVNI